MFKDDAGTKIIRFFCILFILAFTYKQLPAQKKEMFFDKIKGISNPMINAIMQDHQGFLWIGTWGGLNRYDGYNFKVYKSVEGDSTSLCSNGIRDIIEDKANRIWIACNLGFNLYNASNDKFVRILSNPNDSQSLIGNDISCMYLDKKGTLWIGTFFNGLCALDANNSIDFTTTKPLFRQFKHSQDNKNSVSSNFIRSIYEDKESNLWINAHARIIDKYNPANNSFVHIDVGKLPFEEGTEYTSLQFQDSNGKYWFASRGNGFYSWDRKKSEIKQYHRLSYQNSLSFNIVRNIREDRNGILWICTDGGGISFFNKKDETFKYSRYEEANPYSLGSDAAYCSFEDNSGVEWVATFNAGLNKYDAYKSSFKLVRPDLYNKNTLNYKSVLCMIEDRNGNIWIGTDGGGLNVLDKTTGKFSYYVHNPNDINSISSNAITCLVEDFEGNIWIGTYGGILNCFHPKTNKFCRYQNEPGNENSISHNDVWSMTEDSQHNLWIVTIAGTLNLFDSKTRKFYRYKRDPDDPKSFSESYSSKIFEDSRHYILIATSGGVDMFKLKDYDFSKPAPKLKFSHFVHHSNKNSISISSSFSICEDFEGNMWFGTEDGRLNKLDMQNNQFTAYTDEGLKDNSILGILLDKNNDIWLGTVNGLWKFLIKNSSFRRFDLSDGLQDMNFSRACLETRDGQLYFGGLNGYNTFYPDDIPYNKHVPQVVITDFRINNQSVAVGQSFYGKIILNKPVNLIKELVFSNRINFFSLEFAALDFTSPEKNRYLYKLKGFDKQWIGTDSKNRIVTYTNLDAGEYTFMVKACNNDGIWNNTGTELKIKILPPWWKTVWFKTILLFAIVGLIFIAYYLRVALYRKRQKELEETVMQRTQELTNTNKLLTDRQARVEEQAEELKSINEQLLARQTKIEEQAEEILANSSNLKEINELLIDKQKLILSQSDQLKETNQQLSLLNATKDRFFSIIAHDLRNPFNIVTGFSEILLKNYPKLPADKIEKYLDMIYASSLSGNYLLENLLQWSRSQSGHITFEPSELNLYALVEKIIRLLEADAERKHIQIQQTIDSHCIVYADENMINTILRNLISNAIKFSYENGKVLIEAVNNNDHVEISVADNGVGIPQETISKLFRVDSTISTKGTAKEPGTGLGLIICKEFIDKHKGRIWVESTVNKGSSFKFALPFP
jgi:signal transduction histidine kinase/ligand-binding sensor domain-containing protein